jgi:hypothetical protein
MYAPPQARSLEGHASKHGTPISARRRLARRPRRGMYTRRDALASSLIHHGARAFHLRRATRRSESTDARSAGCCCCCQGCCCCCGGGGGGGELRRRRCCCGGELRRRCSCGGELRRRCGGVAAAAAAAAAAELRLLRGVELVSSLSSLCRACRGCRGCRDLRGRVPLGHGALVPKLREGRTQPELEQTATRRARRATVRRRRRRPGQDHGTESRKGYLWSYRASEELLELPAAARAKPVGHALQCASDASV